MKNLLSFTAQVPDLVHQSAGFRTAKMSHFCFLLGIYQAKEDLGLIPGRAREEKSCAVVLAKSACHLDGA